MERVLSQDERIRRAEELYARRKMQIENRTSATVNVENKSKNDLSKKLVIQFFVCVVIYAGFYAIKSIPNIVPAHVMYKISDILEYDINITELKTKINNYITNIQKKENEGNIENIQNSNLIGEEAGIIEPVTDGNIEQNEVIGDNVENMTQPENIEQQANINIIEPEDTSHLSKMELDAKYIKENYVIMKPLDGEITSRFGLRNPTVPTVPKNHTGIDIARVVGTVILASMEGEVKLVSSEGDLGNHVEIANGEVSTVYAHCSKIYVVEGQKVVQGQQIGEVGATGNVTGPHLHFEIKRNNEYVDPDLILDF